MLTDRDTEIQILTNVWMQRCRVTMEERVLTESTATRVTARMDTLENTVVIRL